MRILFATANSKDAYLDLEREHRLLIQAAQDGRHTLKILPAAELGDLTKALSRNENEEPFDVLHFSGHATKDQGIVLRGPAQKEEHLSGERLKDLVAGSGVKLVVLNACNSEAHVKALSNVVPAAIGTTKTVADWAARRFTEKFYGALNENRSVKGAFEAADAQAKSNHPYMHVGTDFDIALPASPSAAVAKIEGEDNFYRTFYGAYIDDQIAAERHADKLGRLVYRAGVAFGFLAVLFVLFWEDHWIYPAIWRRFSALVSIEGGGLKIVERLQAFDAAIPALVTIFQTRLGTLINKRIAGLQHLKNMIDNWDALSEEDRGMIRGVVHNSLKESLSVQESPKLFESVNLNVSLGSNEAEKQ